MIPFLPADILFSILPRAIPPYALLDTTLSAGDNSAWYQTLQLMQSIVLVCRSWYDVGITFLYENVCIRRPHQLESLLQTLTNPSAKHLRLLVKSLTIHCYIPIDRATLEAVMGCCTSLSTFTYNGAIYEQTMLVDFPPHITHLRLEHPHVFDNLFEILTQLQETLLSLHFKAWSDSDFEQSSNSETHWLQSICLTSLQSLSLEGNAFQLGDTLNIISKFWTMPSLQTLTVSTYTKYGNSYSQIAIVSFLELHGHQIRQIGVKGFLFKRELFRRLLTCCPRLERLISRPSIFVPLYLTDPVDFFHPCLRWIDFAHQNRDRDVYGSFELCLSKKKYLQLKGASKKDLPALEGVRHFCNFPDHLEKWVDNYPPSANAEKEGFEIGLFQHQLVYREGLFVLVDL